jgi:uncharacterized protein
MSCEERELIINAKVKLGGTLTVPRFPDKQGEKKPGVLFISGSGQVDRNENTKRFKELNVFNYFASEFCKMGFVSLRYDKRGVGKSEGNYFETGFYDLVEDATSALETLRDQPEVDGNRIFLFGHSEGCYISPLVYRKSPVTGIILLMAPADRLDEVLAYQADCLQVDFKSIPGVKGWFIRLAVRMTSGSDMKKTQEDLKKRVLQTTKPVIRFKLSRMNAKWLREHFQLNVPEIYSSIDCPLLVINGAKDIQVRSDDAEKISKYVRGPVEWHVVDDMTHLLRKDKEKPSILHYKKLLKNPVDPSVMEIVEKWLRGLEITTLGRNEHV